MNSLEHIVNDWPWILKLNALFIVLFLVFIIMVICSLVYLRIYKNQRERHKISYQENADEFLNNYMFNDDFDIKNEIETFKSKHLNTPLKKKITLRQILIYNENFKGESSVLIKKVFQELELDQFVFNILKKGSWYAKARAIYVLSELLVKEPRLVSPYLNAKHEEVREQAIYYFLKTATNNPLSFFKNLKTELTLWELVYIEDSIKYAYTGETPDFSIWLDHHLITIRIFSIKMIQQFNQFENIPKIIPFLYHENPHVRKETIRALYKLHYEALLEKVIPSFKDEEEVVKSEIIKAIQALGRIDQLKELKSLISNQDKRTELTYLQVEKNFMIN
ncbi:HEAT repeat domain-containing protein [Galbibacter pacificus]|uniref:HEAT repeat domain-containing protein n=1 Tax=Galbibacter pacificus TaxID=2996052 RepID=A0ABT6FS12_9FLAO|nr:HEAT repeat domain-containing protein [Galbibacter pacificus]MDG3582823.1 HEAT repeat domain-containing protein [Galbibacter pacificus]MDG3586058.1 HEAT repeat domain-containing protein [Galbibacter pacificus]